MKNSRDIKDLREDMQAACNELISRCAAQGINIMITSTVRDDAYQNTLYQQGRTTAGKIVTNLIKPTFHWDRAGLAFDFCPIDANKRCLWSDTPKFRAVGKIATDMGLEWGGSWKGFVDMPHVQWSQGGKYTSNMIRALNFPPMWGTVPTPTVAAVATAATVNQPVIQVGKLITVATWATQWATGTNINALAKGKQYYIRQIKSDRVLISPAMTGAYTGWLRLQDIQK